MTAQLPGLMPFLSETLLTLSRAAAKNRIPPDEGHLLTRPHPLFTSMLDLLLDSLLLTFKAYVDWIPFELVSDRARQHL